MQVDGFVLKNGQKLKGLTLSGKWGSQLEVKHTDGPKELLWRANALPEIDNRYAFSWLLCMNYCVLTSFSMVGWIGLLEQNCMRAYLFPFAKAHPFRPVLQLASSLQSSKPKWCTKTVQISRSSAKPGQNYRTSLMPSHSAGFIWQSLLQKSQLCLIVRDRSSQWLTLADARTSTCWSQETGKRYPHPFTPSIPCTTFKTREAQF